MLLSKCLQVNVKKGANYLVPPLDVELNARIYFMIR